MTASYILGNLLGRAAISYALVWLACWLLSRLNWRVAFKRSTRWYSLLAVVLLTLLGMGAAVSRRGGLA
ncbi:hypothetical protein [Rhodoferax ferrireducens]|jgi:hypothetical protein|uniref:hypothetical protein n=1 Tax=Rhodoferax ferrireducens TaxID=192843 RepID=UPI000E0DF5CD|nr:hypothetical protein [Rhodoferax ferrireducens]